MYSVTFIIKDLLTFRQLKKCKILAGMKQTVWLFVIIVAAITGLHAMKLKQACFLSGRVFPAACLLRIDAIHDKDTLDVPVNDGAFRLYLSPGGYQILVKGRNPGGQQKIFWVKMGSGQQVQLGNIKLD
jgi:hypothetical protein